jgi:hypothetical protein
VNSESDCVHVHFHTKVRQRGPSCEDVGAENGGRVGVGMPASRPTIVISYQTPRARFVLPRTHVCARVCVFTHGACVCVICVGRELCGVGGCRVAWGEGRVRRRPITRTVSRWSIHAVPLDPGLRPTLSRECVVMCARERSECACVCVMCGPLALSSVFFCKTSLLHSLVRRRLGWPSHVRYQSFTSF